MTYDEWKLETPEDERARRWGVYECEFCSTEYEDPSRQLGCPLGCPTCGKGYRDPDLAREDRHEREWNR
jgi:hypothetical protein